MVEEKKVPWVSKDDSERIIVNPRIATLQLVTSLLTQRLDLGRDFEPGSFQHSLVANKNVPEMNARRAITMRSMTRIRSGSWIGH